MNTFFFRPSGWFPILGMGVWISLLCPCAGQDEVVVISPNWDGIKEETARAFNAWHEKNYGRPAIIRWREAGGGASQIIRFLRSEYQVESSAGIDVLDGGGSDPFRELEKDGLLMRYDPPVELLEQIPADLNGMELIDPDHAWFCTALSGFGILTNERARRAIGLPEARTWSDLTDPRLCGWISAVDPRASSSAMQIYEIILQAYGWEKGWGTLMQMSGNVRQFLSSAAASVVEVGTGDDAYGVTIDMYGNAQAAYYGAENVRFVLPEGETIVSPDAVAILKNPPHPEMARHYVEFTLSRDRQLLWMMPRGSPGGAKQYTINRMSVWPALYGECAGMTPIASNPFTMRNDFVYNSTLAAKRRGVLGVLIAAWMIDTHDVLVGTWKALNSPAAQKLAPEQREKLLARFLAPPCTEAELSTLADTDWTDPIRRTTLINRWQNEALDREKSLLAQIDGE